MSLSRTLDELATELDRLSSEIEALRAALVAAARAGARVVGDVLWWRGEAVGEVRVVLYRDGDPARYYWVTRDALLPDGTCVAVALARGALPSREAAQAGLLEHVARVAAGEQEGSGG